MRTGRPKSKTARDERVQIRLAGALRAALQAEADRDSRPLASHIRKILVDHCAAHVAQHNQEAA
jgi:hypothetical protein